MRLHRLALATVIALLAVTQPCSPARAADPAPDSSLKFIPADAAFYSTSLNLGEQLDRFFSSNAYARLKALPAAKLAAEHIRKAAGDPNNPFAKVMQFLKDPANQELIDLLHDLPRQEIFIFGGTGWADLGPVFMEMNSAQWTAPFQALLAGRPEDANKARLRAILQVLNDSADKLVFPELVIGFKLSKPEPATAQIKRLEGVLNKVTSDTPLRGRVERLPVAGVEALTLTVDGSLVPVDKIPWDQIEDTEGQFRKLRQRLKKVTLTVSLLVKDNYLLLTVGPAAGVAEKLGRGPFLTSRPELAPLAKSADRKFLAISYSSQRLATVAATKPEDLTGLVDLAKGGLDKLPISEKRRTAIDKDLKRLADDMAKHLPKPGASLGFAFLTDRGQESFSYDYSIYPDAVAPKALTILDHLGGSPVIALAGRVADPTPGYRSLASWVKTFYGHVDGAGKELAEQFGQEDTYKRFHDGMEMVQPFLKKFDEITGGQLLPALGEGEAAVVLDAQWTSKQWFKELDQNGKALPMLEVGVVRTVAERDKLVGALQNYRTLINEVMAKAKEFGAPAPEDGMPKPQSKKVSAGTVYYWPLELPEGEVDKQVQPNFGLSDNLFAFSLSFKHSERLMTATPLTTGGGPLAEKRPATFAAVVDFAGMVRAARPWVEQLAVPAILEQVPEDASVPAGVRKKEIPAQVKTVLDVLGCLRTYTSVKYREGEATVTHGELVIRDLQ
jgi:hypothetical protein